MKRNLFVALFLLLTAFARPSFAANTWGTDYSDLWWNPNESGWGVTLTHQGDTVFATFFVHAQDNTAQWYSGAAFSSGTTHPVFTGQLFEGRGPWFGGPFNPQLASNRMVGTVTLDLPGINSGTVTYTVDGVSVTKSIQRQTFRANNMAGAYIGGASYVLTGCGAQSGGYEQSALFNISHSGSTVSIGALLANGSNCTITGNYNQAGRMGDIAGTLACTNGSTATYHAFEIESGRLGFQTRYTADYGGGCTEAGSIGGLKRAGS